MREKNNRNTRVIKGTGRAVLLAVLVHVGLFLLAGMLVVFTVITTQDQQFEPPPRKERPPIKIRKPKPRVKNNSRPKSTARITSTRPGKSAMPSIDLPSLGGPGDELSDGIQFPDIMLNFEKVTGFGDVQTIGNDFVGTFYDFKRDRSGRPIPMNQSEYAEKVGLFTRGNFDKAKLANFYRSPKKLYASCFMVPTMLSSVAPKAFGEESTGGWCWMAHYEGKLVHTDAITFRFVGQADDIMVVRVDGEVVLNASWPNTEQIYSNWTTSDPKSRTYMLGNNRAVFGDWITLAPGVELDMEVVCGERPGGHFDMLLLVEEKGVEYPMNDQPGPILPMFKTAEPGHDLRDAIYEWLVPGEASITNGPVFCDFSVRPSNETAKPAVLETNDPPVMADPEEAGPRTWQLASGQTVDAEAGNIFGDKVTLTNPSGKSTKVPWDQLSPDDQRYLNLLNPPKFEITFSKQSKQKILESSPFHSAPPPRLFDYTFKVRVKQRTARAYPHLVNIEFFAVGQQYLDDEKYILMDRHSGGFVPDEKNRRSAELKGERTVEMSNYILRSTERGEKYKGYLVVLRDERGHIIQYAASNEWLYENLENLEQVPVGRFFDKTCKRVHPTGPKRWY